jgi:hypothetical protein
MPFGDEARAPDPFRCGLRRRAESRDGLRAIWIGTTVVVDMTGSAWYDLI